MRVPPLHSRSLSSTAHSATVTHGWLQVLAWLRCKVARTVAALRASGGSAFVGMDDAGLAAYAAGLLGEWLAPAWQRRLAAACGLPASGNGPQAGLGTLPARGAGAGAALTS